MRDWWVLRLGVEHGSRAGDFDDTQPVTLSDRRTDRPQVGCVREPRALEVRGSWTAAHPGTACRARPPADRRGGSHPPRGNGRREAPTSRAQFAPAPPCHAPVTIPPQPGNTLRVGGALDPPQDQFPSGRTADTHVDADARSSSRNARRSGNGSTPAIRSGLEASNRCAACVRAARPDESITCSCVAKSHPRA